MTAVFKIRNWHRFQHFKDRRPIWIKLYRDILDDIHWHELDPTSAKTLIMLWLIASENNGDLPGVAELSFRLRMPESRVLTAIQALSGWVYQVDISLISDRYQPDILEKRREETETDSRAPAREAVSVLPSDFDRFWASYPRKVGKDAARKAWHARKKELPPIADILAAVDAQRRSDAWQKDGGQFIPHPATWLRQGRWADEVIVAGQPAQQQPTAVSPELSERLFLEARRAADKKHGIVREGAQ